MAKNSKPTKSKKQNPSEQGFPKIYLRTDGAAFKPGYDAAAKRDLIAAVLQLDNSKALHKFRPADAQKLIAARGWESWLDRKKELLAEKAKAAEEREAAKAAKAAESKVSEEAKK